MARPVHPARAVALAAGQRHYEGEACPKGHTTRHAHNRACVQCQADWQRTRRKAARVPSTALDDLLG